MLDVTEDAVGFAEAATPYSRELNIESEMISLGMIRVLCQIGSNRSTMNLE